jgi:hypothetical protein
MLLFLPSSSSAILTSTHEAEWTPFQTHCLSENLEAPGIEPGTSGIRRLTCNSVVCGSSIGETEV